MPWYNWLRSSSILCTKLISPCIGLVTAAPITLSQDFSVDICSLIYCIHSLTCAKKINYKKKEKDNIHNTWQTFKAVSHWLSSSNHIHGKKKLGVPAGVQQKLPPSSHLLFTHSSRLPPSGQGQMGCRIPLGQGNYPLTGGSPVNQPLKDLWDLVGIAASKESDNIFVAEYLRQVILRIDSRGIKTIFAGCGFKSKI